MSTERDGTEEALSGREPSFLAQLQATLNVVPAHTWYAAPAGGLTFVNKRTADYLGLPKDDPLRSGIDAGAPFDAHIPFLHPDDRESSRRAWLASIHTGEASEHSFRVRSAQGGYRWFLSRVEPLRASDGTLLLWVGANLDIDEFKCAEDALRESEYKLLQIIETVPSLVWSLASNGEPTHYNKRMLDYFGKTYEDFRNGGWGAFVHPDDLPEAESAFFHDIRAGISHQAVLRLRRADGAYLWHHSRCEPLRDQHGRIVQWYGLSVDIDEAKKAEDLLRRSEAYLAEAQRLSHTGAMRYDGTTILYASEETYRIWGFDPAQGVPSHETVFQRIHPGDRERLNAEVRRAVDEKRRYSIGYRIVLPNGTVKHLETIGEPVFSASGKLAEIATTQTDVTERKRAEEALRESESKLRQIFETVPGLLWSTDPAGEPTQLNQRMLDYTGMRFEDFKHGGWEAFVHPDDFPETVRALQHAIQAGTSYQLVNRLRRADGQFRWHQTRGEPLRDRHGRIVQWYGVSVDIDEGKKAEDLLRRSEAYLAEAQWLGHTGSAAYNDTVILYWSDETYRIFGRDPRDGLPSREAVQQAIHPDDRERVKEHALRAVRKKRDYKLDYRIVLLGGTVKHIEMAAHPKFSTSGELMEVISTLIDVTERKRAEQALRESEYKLRQVMDTVPGLTWSTGQPGFMAQVQAILNVLPAYIWYAPPSGGLTFVNKRQADFLGVPKDHPLRFGIDTGAQWDAHIPFLHPDDQVEGRRRWSDSLRTGKGYEYNYRVRTAQGDYRWFHTRTEPLLASDGTLLLWVGATLDIQELKRAEEGLRESEAKFRDYAETASDWFWEIDADFKFTMLTENAFGGNAAHRVGTSSLDYALDLETEPEKWRAALATIDAREPYRDLVYCAVRGDGAPMYVRVSGKPVFDARGTYLGYRGTSTDVTAIVRAQEALRESEQRSRSALDGIAGLVAVMSPTGELETVNRQCSEYFGRSLEWLKNWGMNEAVHPEDLPRIGELFKSAIASGIPFNYELRLRRFDDEYRWFDNRGVPIRDDSGRIVRWYVLMTDNEDRMQALARLDQMQSDFAHMNRVSVMGEMTASLAHEITQPIASARNNARAALNFLDRQPPDLGEVREALHSIVGDADRAGDIVDRIRDQVKKAPPRKARCDLNEAISEVIVLARSAIVKNGVSVQTRFAEGLLPVDGDRVQLQQVVLNLILNAVEAMSTVEMGPRELLISTEQTRPGGVLVSLRDSGPGIDPDHLDRLFEAFYTTKSSGVGIGLSICRSIIDAHGGRLWADANAPRGAVFQFTLPGADKEFMIPPPASRPTGKQHEGTVSDASHQPAYEGSKRSHRSRRVSGQCRWDRQ
jgi:PAS domain S-box-containing protein